MVDTLIIRACKMKDGKFYPFKRIEEKFREWFPFKTTGKDMVRCFIGCWDGRRSWDIHTYWRENKG